MWIGACEARESQARDQHHRQWQRTRGERKVTDPYADAHWGDKPRSLVLSAKGLDAAKWDPMRTIAASYIESSTLLPQTMTRMGQTSTKMIHWTAIASFLTLQP